MFNSQHLDPIFTQLVLDGLNQGGIKKETKQKNKKCNFEIQIWSGKMK